MIKTIIFDFGNVFINLDIEGAHKSALKSLKIDGFSDELLEVFESFEKGLIETNSFAKLVTDKYPHISKSEFIDMWNFMLKDFPKYRLDFLVNLKQSSKYKLILLSNTNDIHINYIRENVSFYETFKNCFDEFYLSHEIHLIKPNNNIFEFVLNNNNLKPEECLFVDDNADNIDTANKININTWHIDPKTEDVINLFETKKDLF
jgi:putative hydrolase of the HAD superfamily